METQKAFSISSVKHMGNSNYLDSVNYKEDNDANRKQLLYHNPHHPWTQQPSLALKTRGQRRKIKNQLKSSAHHRTSPARQGWNKRNRTDFKIKIILSYKMCPCRSPWAPGPWEHSGLVHFQFTRTVNRGSHWGLPRKRLASHPGASRDFRRLAPKGTREGSTFFSPSPMISCATRRKSQEAHRYEAVKRPKKSVVRSKNWKHI